MEVLVCSCVLLGPALLSGAGASLSSGDGGGGGGEGGDLVASSSSSSPVAMMSVFASVCLSVCVVLLVVCCAFFRQKHHQQSQGETRSNEEEGISPKEEEAAAGKRWHQLQYTRTDNTGEAGSFEVHEMPTAEIKSEMSARRLEANGPRRMEREKAAAAVRQPEGHLDLEPKAILATEKRSSYHSSAEVSETDRLEAVALVSEDGVGPGISIGRTSSGEIFVKDVLPNGPAMKTKRVHRGDRISSMAISLENMTLEHAQAILDLAQHYPIELHLLKTSSDADVHHDPPFPSDEPLRSPIAQERPKKSLSMNLSPARDGGDRVPKEGIGRLSAGFDQLPPASGELSSRWRYENQPHLGKSELEAGARGTGFGLRHQGGAYKKDEGLEEDEEEEEEEEEEEKLDPGTQSDVQEEEEEEDKRKSLPESNLSDLKIQFSGLNSNNGKDRSLMADIFPHLSSEIKAEKALETTKVGQHEEALQNGGSNIDDGNEATDDEQTKLDSINIDQNPEEKDDLKANSYFGSSGTAVEGLMSPAVKTAHSNDEDMEAGEVKTTDSRLLLEAGSVDAASRDDANFERSVLSGSYKPIDLSAISDWNLDLTNLGNSDFEGSKYDAKADEELAKSPKPLGVKGDSNASLGFRTEIHRDLAPEDNQQTDKKFNESGKKEDLNQSIANAEPDSPKTEIDLKLDGPNAEPGNKLSPVLIKDSKGKTGSIGDRFNDLFSSWKTGKSFQTANNTDRIALYNGGRMAEIESKDEDSLINYLIGKESSEGFDQREIGVIEPLGVGNGDGDAEDSLRETGRSLPNHGTPRISDSENGVEKTEKSKTAHVLLQNTETKNAVSTPEHNPEEHDDEAVGTSEGKEDGQDGKTLFSLGLPPPPTMLSIGNNDKAKTYFAKDELNSSLEKNDSQSIAKVSVSSSNVKTSTHHGLGTGSSDTFFDWSKLKLEPLELPWDSLGFSGEAKTEDRNNNVLIESSDA